MQHSRVLGTIGLVAATALSAFGPGTTSLAAPTQTVHTTVQRVSNSVADARLQTALKTGYLVSARGTHIPLSSALRNFVKSGTASKAKAKGAAHADSSLPVRQLNGSVEANQDYGYYATGNGALFHNTESVAVDPLNPGHVVVGATDNRTGDPGANFNYGSNPAPNLSTTNPLCIGSTAIVSDLPYFSCDLIQALGGPGIYNSVDGGNTFSNLIIPDMLTGAVPDAISPFIVPISPTVPLCTVNCLRFTPKSIVATSPVTGTQVSCLANSLTGSNTFNVTGEPNACTPYDSVGDQSVAFDSVGNLYTASLGVINYPPNGVTPTLPVFPQTDIVLNASPAVQPIGAAALLATTFPGSYSPALITPPMSAGRFFSAPPATSSCNVFQVDPLMLAEPLCLHNEVVASNSPYDYISTTIANTVVANMGTTPISGNVSITATAVGRNFQADANNNAAGAFGSGSCGWDTINGDICLIDSPYLVIDANSTRPTMAYLTYTVIDFNLDSSNIYLTSSNLLNANPGAGLLPFWTTPVQVDSSFIDGNGIQRGFAVPSCANVSPFSSTCSASWGAQPTVGPDGTLYIAYENADYLSNTPFQFFNQILVAWQYTNPDSATNTAMPFIRGTAIANQSVVDHDAYNFNVYCPLNATDPTCRSGSYASLDADSGAFFTIPNRPSIAVTGAIANNPFGTVVVVYTTQGGQAFNPSTSNGAIGTRVDSVTLTPSGVEDGVTPFDFGLGNGSVPVDVAPQAATVNQFFPWVAASQTVFPGTSATLNKDSVIVGFYQETPGTVTFSSDDNSVLSTAKLTYLSARSSDYNTAASGAMTFGATIIDANMPLPEPPASAAYGDYLIGTTLPQVTPNPLVNPLVTAADWTTEFAGWNAVPYFGTYTGAASDNGNGAYLSWTDTKANIHDFGVAGSQNVNVTHVG